MPSTTSSPIEAEKPSDLRFNQIEACLEQLRRWPSDSAKEWTYQFVRQACSARDTRALLAIGSMVRPIGYPSDVDLVYIYEGATPPISGHPFDVDIRLYSAEEVPCLVARGHDLLGWAMRFGVLLCESYSYWSDLQSDWSHGSPLPDPSVAEMRANRAERFRDDMLRMGDVEAANDQAISALSHQAWAQLLRAGIYPMSRPELPGQLRAVGAETLAHAIEQALSENAGGAGRSSQLVAVG